MDRCEALGEARGAPDATVGIEIGSFSDTYAWETSGDARHFTKATLFPDQNVDRLRWFSVAAALVGAVRRHRIDSLFVAGYEQPGIAVAALILRMLGVRVFVALDSKFDDKPRRLRLELMKRVLMLPYHGGFASGPRAASYLRFLGLHRRPVAMGYDVVDLDRIRALAPADEPDWADRHFLVVARFVPKKNLRTAIAALATYDRNRTGPARRMRLCGAGPGEPELRAEAARLGVAHLIDFCGFVDQATLALELRSALCLLLPSLEEQWGLVVNEAIAFDLPILISDRVGAADWLVGTWDNGFVLDPNLPDAWAEAMVRLAEDAPLWQRMRAGTRLRRPLADVAAFVSAVGELTRRGRRRIAG